MSSYGVTDKGFVLKRMDTIMEQVHSDLTEGFGVDTRLSESSFLNVVVTTFCGQIAELWETAQDDYYAKYPTTATGVNLDNAVQFGGIRRKSKEKNLYSLHCTGDDGTVLREGAIVATNTLPEVRLYSAKEATISRETFNSVGVIVAVAEIGDYSITINGEQFSYTSTEANNETILEGLKNVITNNEYEVIIEEGVLKIEDTVKSRSNGLILSENLTTEYVTCIVNFYTEDYGKITLPDGIVSKIINNIPGFESVTNMLVPIYGRLEETDIELRQSYLARSAIRSNTMLDSIVSEILNNVTGVESASGYENDGDEIDSRGLPPHSIEVVVEGGADNAIASAILKKKAGGIQTYGNVTVNVDGKYGDVIPVKFNRPEYLYTWLKVVLHGDYSKMPINYEEITKEVIANETSKMVAGSSLLIQLLNEGIYNAVPGITYVDIYTATTTDKTVEPSEDDYQLSNVIATSRQKVVVAYERIEVSLNDAS